MFFVALAGDYDGTLARDGWVDAAAVVYRGHLRTE